MAVTFKKFFFFDNLHKMSKPTFWETLGKYFKMLSAEIFTQHAEC